MANAKRKCAQCKERFRVETGIITPVGFFCTHEHRMKYAYNSDNTSSLVEVGDKTRKKNNKAKLLELNRKSLNWQHKKTQKAFNKMRVLEELEWFAERGMKPTCISCGNELGGDQWCCGHFKTQGGNGRIRYDRKNTFIQHNHRCNKQLSGDIEGSHNTHGYKQGLINRFGVDEAYKIMAYCDSNTGPKKWSCDELEELRKQCNSRIRELQQRLAA